MSVTSEATNALAFCLKRIEAEFKDVPDGQEMVDKLTAKFVQTSNAPPRQDFEFVMRKPFSDDEVCIALFSPREDQIPYYAAMLVAAQELPAGNPVSKLCPLLVSLLFLVHRKNWAFMRAFIGCGGLDSLVPFIDDQNLYLRGQVLEILLSATDCDTFDWFRRPESTADKLLHQSLLAVGRSPILLQKLLANRIGSYPGGSFRALQLIAFTLSWVRALYTADQKLQLSPKALSELQLWAETASSSSGPGKGPAVAREEEQEDPEGQLARTLVDDFGGAQNAPDASAAGPGAASSNAYLMTAIDDTALGTPASPLETDGASAKSNERTPPSNDAFMAVNLPPPPPVELSAEDLKEQGNNHFKAGRHDAAIESYRTALQVDHKSSSTKATCHELEVSLHCNIATASWKVVQDLLSQHPVLELGETECGDPPLLAVLQRYQSSVECCIAECRAALSLQTTCAKAAYRLASVLLLQRLPLEALAVTQSCMDAITASKGPNAQNAVPVDASETSGLASDASSSAGNVDLLLQIKRRCIAAVLLSQRDGRLAAASSLEGVDLGLTPKTSEILKSLLVQYQIELDLPVGGNGSSGAAQQDASTIAASNSATNSVLRAADKEGASTKPKKMKSSKAKDAKEEAAPVEVAVSSTSKAMAGDKVKAKKKVSVGGVAGYGAKSSTSSVAQRLQEIDDNMLDSLMKRSSIKT